MATGRILTEAHERQAYEVPASVWTLESIGQGDMDEGLVLVQAVQRPDVSEDQVDGAGPQDAPQLDPPAAVEATAQITVALTFYVCSGAPPGFQDGYCGTMASGRTVYEGAAACGLGLPLGQRFAFGGREFVCEDRGRGPDDWVDIFFWDYTEGRSWRDGFGETVTVAVERG